jgi:Kef-type K+ transport system membrane component KefB
VSETVWAVAQFASIILLFVTGLHTDLEQFLKYIRPATLVAVAGLVVPFAFGALAVYIPPFAKLAQGGPTGGTLIPALFVGVMLAATSIGITARVLGDIGRLDTPEGVTILGAAVLDDVLGIVALAIVGGIASAGTISGGAVALIAGKAFGFWIGLTLLTLVLARPIEWALTRIKYSGAMVGLALALAFVSSGAAESFGLAFIIGAYSVGLGLSRTKMARKLMDQLEPISAFVVPIFFAALGMLVNVQAMLASWGVIAFGLVITFVAIAGKVVGCGMAARRTGFNRVGAYRIGLGMMPRGEVALIVAGIGLSRQIIGEVVFGVSIMMTLVTTVLAPILLVPAFRKGGSGRERPEEAAEGLPTPSVDPGFEVVVPPGLCGTFVDRLLAVAQSRGWEPVYDRADEDIYLLRSRGDAAQVTATGQAVRVDASDPRQPEFVAMVAAVRDAIQREAGEVAVRPLPGANVPTGAAVPTPDPHPT